MISAVSLTDLAIARGGQCLLRDVSLTLRAGCVNVIMGANGIGKSTLLQTIAGLVSPLAGSIDLAGIASYDIHYLGHHQSLWPMLTVAENCQLIATLRGSQSLPRIRAALAFFNLQDCSQRLASQCSAGQRQRLALVALLLNPGKLWLLDEPWTALDPDSQKKLWHLIEEHCRRDGLVCVTSHQHLQHDKLAINEISLQHAH